MALKYGFLQGTFGLPYGGYCVQPRTLADILLDASNQHLSMFCVTGTYAEVLAWLSRQDDIMVANHHCTQDTYTHDLVVELYTHSSRLKRLFKGLSGTDVQLVIRIARTWDRRLNRTSQDFRPLVKIIVPAGITLKEISEKMRTSAPDSVVDATADKGLLSVVLERVSTRDSMQWREVRASMESRERMEVCDTRGSQESSSRVRFLLPVYRRSEQPPPAYAE
ncbi:hypothetical protein EC988_001883 [Linderina pennispora]|nr:hypothetical protein EC988_001883 [Linderina pennispora]